MRMTSHARQILFLAIVALLGLPLMSFSCSDQKDPCDPPCNDDNATATFHVGHNHYNCLCWCPNENMTMIVTYFDMNTKQKLGQSRFSATGSDCVATTLPKVPTCIDVLVTVTWICDEGPCENHRPNYQEQYLEINSVPCGGNKDLTVDIHCAEWI